MTIPRTPQVVARCMAVVGMVVLTTSLHAQTPPRPAVDVRQMPTLWESVIPADFNRDGRIDLIAGERNTARVDRSGPVWVRLGNGNGTFAAPLSSGVTGTPVTTGDFNRDGRLDAVAIGSDGAVSILPGRGNGKFDAPRPLDPVEDFRFALSADMDADGILDLVLGYGTTVDVQTGFGDFTFLQHPLPPGNDDGPSIAVVADFNGDNRPDLAVAQKSTSVFVYLNRGGLLFSATELVIAEGFEDFPEQIRGLASADLDGDGDQDLVVPHTVEENRGWSEGGVEVLLGNGNGTFAAPVRHLTGLGGPMTVATGDFNADGRMDIAVGSRSFGWDDLENFLNGWDSISIFSGRGDGTFTVPARFRLDTTPPGSATRSAYLDTHTALRAANINGDARIDLVTSPGAVVLMRPPAANRRPSVSAGPDRSAFAGSYVLINAAITELDWDLLSVEWHDDEGFLRSFGPSLASFGHQDQTFTVTVTDDRGGTATDTVTIRRVRPGSGPVIRITSPVAGRRYPSGSTIPIEWDISNEILQPREVRVSISSDNFRSWRVIEETPGFGTFNWVNAGPPGTTWRVRVDAFGEGASFATAVSEPFIIEDAAASALPWPWESTDVGFVGTAGRATHTSGTFTVRGAGRDVWGTADAFHFAHQRLIGDGSIAARVAAISGSQAWTKVGIMIRESLADNAAHHFLLASLSKGNAYQRRPTTGAASLHTALASATAPVFRIVRRGGTVTLQMATAVGATFHTVSTVAFPAGPAYVGLVTSSHETERLATGTFDRVQVQGGGDLPPSVTVTFPTGIALRSGETSHIDWTVSDDNGIAQFDVFFRDDGTGELVTLCFELPGTARTCSWTVPNIAGPSGSVIVHATDIAGHHGEGISSFTIEDSGGGSLPLGWSALDVGAVGAAGSTSEANGRWTVRGSGAAVWGTSDEFHYAFAQHVRGDFEFTARVVSVDNVNEWTKAGLMARASIGPDGRHAFVLATPTTRRGVVFHRRPVEGGTTLHTAGPRVTAPVWLKLERLGNVVSSFTRTALTDAWTLIGRQSFDGPVGFVIGFAVASYADGTLATGVFDNVTLVPR